MQRFLVHALEALAVISGSLAIGVLGYHTLENLSWLDALVNASMILGGMGPVNALHTAAGKIFASLYALYSGIIFLVVVGILFAPIYHRFLHRFHLEFGEEKTAEERSE
jgi:hypothetical protein